MWISHRKEIRKLTFRAKRQLSNLFTMANSHYPLNYWIVFLISFAGVAKHMTIVTTTWLQTISVPIGGCHILLFTFTLGVINVVRSCPIDQMDVFCCLILHPSLYSDLVMKESALEVQVSFIGPNTSEYEENLLASCYCRKMKVVIPGSLLVQNWPQILYFTVESHTRGMPRNTKP